MITVDSNPLCHHFNLIVIFLFNFLVLFIILYYYSFRYRFSNIIKRPFMYDLIFVMALFIFYRVNRFLKIKYLYLSFYYFVETPKYLYLVQWTQIREFISLIKEKSLSYDVNLMGTARRVRKSYSVYRKSF